MTSSPSLLRKTIQSFLRHGGPTYRILDARSRDAYLMGPRLVPSTNIPHQKLASSLFQLPPKSTAFAVLETPQDTTITTIDSREGDWQDINMRAYDRTAHSSSESLVPTTEMLQEHGWNAKWTFQDQPEFWSAFQSEIISLQSRNDHAPQLPRIDPGQQSSMDRYHFLFQPNPFLVKVLPQIERELVVSRCLEPSPELLRCLDLGCGAGRDMTYMVARTPNHMAELQAEWSVIGIDEWHVACERAEQLARDTFGNDGPMDATQGSNNNNNEYASRISTIIGKVDPKTGVLWLKPKPSEKGSRTTSTSLFLDKIQYDISCRDNLFVDALKAYPERSSDRFDLIIMIRFLERAVLAPMVEHWLRPGGFIVWSTFVADPDLPVYSKPGPGHRLNSKDEARIILLELGLDIVVSEISRVEDGKRSVANIVARKKRK
ncbi:hypothetical protein BGZ92_006943 [Podila epicladia]|nr:hypothetical protein BGZ92_006943 [Podila epicladia]